MDKICTECGNNIPQKRTELGYKTCVNCSTTDSYGFVNIVNHKTGNTVQPMPKEQAQAINKIGERKRFGTVLKGGSKNDSYNPKHTKHKVSTVVIGSEKLFEKVGEEALYLCETKGFDTASLYIDKEVKDYVISGSQAFQLRQIMRVLQG
jgi:hypothetical protein